VRTNSDTQNGSRHNSRSMAFVRPCATRAMYSAIGKASTRVMAVTRIDMIAVRAKVRQ
jgi:hypothetical protein